MTTLLLSPLKALVIDMDGVLWRGDTLLPGFDRFFKFIRDNEIPFMLATNNARKTPQQYVERLAGFGVTIQPYEVLTSAIATMAYMQNNYPPGTRVYAIGEDGLILALTEAGYELTDTAAEVVVVGLDMSVNYQKLKTATLLIRAGADYIGTNPDLTFPVEGSFAPGNGAILTCITVSTDKEPVIMGKPSRVMFDIALQRLGGQAKETAMIGDRLETDIVGAQETGMKTILVFSGVSQPEDLETSDIKPDWCFSTIDELISVWENET